ncbi:MAG: hypothetical protein MI919_35565 [Holophagales bacterium]|nr:hypothetical protein [Holophagales bacterium]
MIYNLVLRFDFSLQTGARKRNGSLRLPLRPPFERDVENLLRCELEIGGCLRIPLEVFIRPEDEVGDAIVWYVDTEHIDPEVDLVCRSVRFADSAQHFEKLGARDISDSQIDR